MYKFKIKENLALIREAERMGKDQAAQKDVNNLIEQLSLGNDNPGIGNRRVKNLKNVSEARGRNEGRVYFREKNGKIEEIIHARKINKKFKAKTAHFKNFNMQSLIKLCIIIKKSLIYHLKYKLSFF